MARLSPDALRLYLVTDQSMLRGRTLADVVAAAVQGGVSCVKSNWAAASFWRRRGCSKSCWRRTACRW